MFLGGCAQLCSGPKYIPQKIPTTNRRNLFIPSALIPPFQVSVELLIQLFPGLFNQMQNARIPNPADIGSSVRGWSQKQPNNNSSKLKGLFITAG